MMEDRSINTHDIGAILIGLMLTLSLALTGCGGGDSGPEYDASCPLCEPEDFEDHVLMSCPIYYRWNGITDSWTACDTEWTLVANQPVFTDIWDCLTAKGHLLDENSTYWENNQEDKDRGYAWKLFCFSAD